MAGITWFPDDEDAINPGICSICSGDTLDPDISICTDCGAEIYGEDVTDTDDDDPQCVCGVFLSEHSMMGCPEGFQTPDQWKAWKERLYANDDFPEYLEWQDAFGPEDNYERL